jgi:hypothetical protein
LRKALQYHAVLRYIIQSHGVGPVSAPFHRDNLGFMDAWLLWHVRRRPEGYFEVSNKR